MNTDTQTITIQEFIEKHGLTLELKDSPGNPHMEDWQNKLNYYYAIRGQHKDGKAIPVTMHGYFSTGFGWIEQRPNLSEGALSEIKRLAPHGVELIRAKDGSLVFTARRRTITLHDADSLRQCHRIKKPTLADILDCLASDASSTDQSFENWCADLGYDSDSRKAFRTFELCSQEAKDLKALLGNDAYQELLYNTERL